MPEPVLRVVRAYPVPDKKSVDEWGNPSRWILRLENGKIAFPDGFEIDPRRREYLVEIVKEAPRYAIVKLHKHKWTWTWNNEYVRIVCAGCGEWVMSCTWNFVTPCVDKAKELSIPVPEKVREKHVAEVRKMIVERVLRELVKALLKPYLHTTKDSEITKAIKIASHLANIMPQYIIESVIDDNPFLWEAWRAHEKGNLKMINEG
jgi:hypothetical protein